MNRFNDPTQRLLMLLVYGPLGLGLFGVLGVMVLRDEWGLTDGRVLAGVAAGAALAGVLAVITARRWNHQLTSAEVRGAQQAFADREERAWPRWAAYGLTGLSIGVAIMLGTAFGAALLFTLMTLVTVLAWVIALGRRGMFQETVDAEVADARG